MHVPDLLINQNEQETLWQVELKETMAREHDNRLTLQVRTAILASIL